MWEEEEEKVKREEEKNKRADELSTGSTSPNSANTLKIVDSAFGCDGSFLKPSYCLFLFDRIRSLKEPQES